MLDSLFVGFAFSAVLNALGSVFADASIFSSLLAGYITASMVNQSYEDRTQDLNLAKKANRKQTQ